MLDINQNIPLWLSLFFVFGGLLFLSWSADRFVESAARLARAFGVSPLIVGMVIIGFGTSAPELAVSVLSGLADKADLSLGNAYGSCIFNLAAILGISALVWPLRVKPSVVFLSVPLLILISLLSLALVWDNRFQWWNGAVLVGAFAVIMPLYCWYDQTHSSSPKKKPEVDASEPARPKVRVLDFVWGVLGLALLVGSSHILVWGCVDFARDVFKVSPLMIGLTVVAAGTSLPELASAVASARRKEHEFVIGNIVGSNIFNTLAVVGIAGWISPYAGYSKYIISRDIPVMIVMSLALAIFGVNWKRPAQSGRIYRWEGVLWILSFLVYVAVMILQETGHW